MAERRLAVTYRVRRYRLMMAFIRLAAIAARAHLPGRALLAFTRWAVGLMRPEYRLAGEKRWRRLDVRPTDLVDAQLVKRDGLKRGAGR